MREKSEAAAYLSPYLVLLYRWSGLTDQHGRCSTLKIRHPFPKSSLSQELEKRTESKNQYSINQAVLWHHQKGHHVSGLFVVK